MTVDTSPIRDRGHLPDGPGTAPAPTTDPATAHRVSGPTRVTGPTRVPRAGGDVGDLVTQAAQAFQDYRDGVSGGIDRLVRLVSPLLWHTARQCGLSAAEAEDAVQQTFLALVRRGAGITDPMAVVRWLTVTLRRQAWRDRAAARTRTDAEPTDDDLPREPSAEAAAVLTDEQQRLWAHVHALPDRCRRLLAVIAFAPRPDYAAIAKDMNMPVGSIGPTRGRCLEKLRLRLKGEEWS
ncbi:sigma-70 family RNA polymerase sigma factor [Nakamurella sp. YIM 132087]|uniref:Sigma-70 family RNA polymerase sigma factor n=1 Tax=Nakamurella alba TaxID=2665158 RepID=A0A7K1FRM9_9ACTN|nr:sigma-70 family RNA polymerase sigma factor [Nakamurella alba]MTD16796.1 sigma-70 family RNA polymerase sigma factor [Nakamurella alba]